MKNRKEFLIIAAFIISVIGFFVTIYSLFIVKNMSNTIFYGSSIVNILVIIFLIFYLIKNRQSVN